MFKGILLFFVLGVGVFLVSNQILAVAWTEADISDLDDAHIRDVIAFKDYLYISTCRMEADEFGDGYCSIDKKVLRTNNLSDWEEAYNYDPDGDVNSGHILKVFLMVNYF